MVNKCFKVASFYLSACTVCPTSASGSWTFCVVWLFCMSLHLTRTHRVLCLNQNMKVFLGGSCGETTWRQDAVIPFLNEVGIEFFNPQKEVGQWSLEDQQRENEEKDVSCDIFLPLWCVIFLLWSNFTWTEFGCSLQVCNVFIFFIESMTSIYSMLEAMALVDVCCNINLARFWLFAMRLHRNSFVLKAYRNDKRVALVFGSSFVSRWRTITWDWLKQPVQPTTATWAGSDPSVNFSVWLPKSKKWSLLRRVSWKTGGSCPGVVLMQHSKTGLSDKG